MSAWTPALRIVQSMDHEQEFRGLTTCSLVRKFLGTRLVAVNLQQIVSHVGHGRQTTLAQGRELIKERSSKTTDEPGKQNVIALISSLTQP